MASKIIALQIAFLIGQILCGFTMPWEIVLAPAEIVLLVFFALTVYGYAVANISSLVGDDEKYFSYFENSIPMLIAIVASLTLFILKCLFIIDVPWFIILIAAPLITETVDIALFTNHCLKFEKENAERIKKN